MSVDQGQIDHAIDLFAPLGGITSRNMMGGLSIYCRDQIFAILDHDGTLFLKASGTFADTLANQGSIKFEMEDGRGMNYWTMPEDGLDDPQTASDWGQGALDALKG